MIDIVGCGPGSEDYLTPTAREAMARADVVFGAARLLDLCPDGRAEKIVVIGDVDRAVEEIESRRKAGREVCVLVSGDPGLFSLAAHVIKKSGREHCRVIPGVSSVQAAFARVGVSWQDATIISAHHHLPELESFDPDSCSKLAVLAGHEDVLAWLHDLTDRFTDTMTIFSCENLTLKDELIRELQPDDIAGLTFERRCVFLIIRRDCVP